jgi:hypothetical protein
VQLFTAPFPKRRAVYAYIDRQNLPGTLRTFDFASPDLMNPQRATTSVPQQALYMMNSPFVIAQAETLADGPDFASAAPEERQVQMLYQSIFARNATPQEVAAAIAFVKAAESATREPAPAPVWQYGYGAYDEAANKVTFTALPHWTGSAWQGGAKLPDPKLGWVTITADGGHPDRDRSVIRRFTAPRDMNVAISGDLNRPAAAGNGVLARIVSSRTGQLAEFAAEPKATISCGVAQAELKAGDTVDFIVESRGDNNSDSFNWHPAIRSSDGVEFNAKTQFAGPRPKIPPLTPWEKFAQVLLETNEFLFVD